MSGVDDELTEGIVFRFGVRRAEDMFYAEYRRPLVIDFDLGSDETAEARKQHFASLSVWDEARTTVDQAREFISPERRLPLWLSVADIRALQHDLKVVRAPHAKELPGREGHCDIQNVWSDDKLTRRKIRADLRDIATCSREDLPQSL